MLIHKYIINFGRAKHKNHVAQFLHYFNVIFLSRLKVCHSTNKSSHCPSYERQAKFDNLQLSLPIILMPTLFC